MRNKKNGFTLVELLATLVILGIVISITLVAVNSSYQKTRNNTEKVFVKTLEDALAIYIDSSDAKSLEFDKDHPICSGIYKTTSDLTFEDVINSEYSPLTEADLVNPANKDKDNYQCHSDAHLDIYRDSNYVYYYKISKRALGCLNETGNITNLPEGCNE